MSTNDENDEKIQNSRREALRGFFVKPVQSVIKNMQEPETVSVNPPAASAPAEPVAALADGEPQTETAPDEPKSYDNVEVKRFLEDTGVINDFDHDLPRQWESIKKVYRKDYPENEADFAFLLETTLAQDEIEAAKSRFAQAILDRFTEDELKTINEFSQTDLGIKLRDLYILVKDGLRKERTVISVNIGRQLDEAVARVKKGKA